jgi:hypothetical protein
LQNHLICAASAIMLHEPRTAHIGGDARACDFLG